jgi:hypothetical protein
MKILLATITALGLCFVGCAADDANDPDAGLPSCAEVGCPTSALCTSDGTCWCHLDNESIECEPTPPDAL